MVEVLMPDLIEPITRAQADAAIPWDRPPYSRIPAERRHVVVTYHHKIAGVEECFWHLDDGKIRARSQFTAEGKPLAVTDGAADRYIAGLFALLGTWHAALDTLDGELRGGVAGGLPEWAEDLVKLEAFGLFGASYALLRAVAEYHHGTAGPKVSADDDFAYVLTGGVVNPFT
jgi:hypothetical protein